MTDYFKEYDLKDYSEIVQELTEYYSKSLDIDFQRGSFFNTFDRVMAEKVFKISMTEICLQDRNCIVYDIPEPEAEAFVVYAQRRPILFDYCIHICTANIINGAPLPLALRFFSTRVLDGEIKRPTPAHRERRSDFDKSVVTYQMLVTAAVLHGLPLTRNDATDGGSACDAVAEAMKNCGERVTYTQLKDFCVHPKKKNLRDEVETFLRFENGDQAVLISTPSPTRGLREILTKIHGTR
ncbi:hypothetical protein [Ruegeria arenilitoris]|uniref:Uncharacterized protein n=1 Tax=Ruegeria arenilitoris TaxID=1173585 RepID=A0A238KMN9_9RHOB|nr:hypothetical protein [Ruegeria arenilitoris]SMX43917.1 hypothetical protein RUA8715_02304 [Ruegeria arenilitoris]